MPNSSSVTAGDTGTATQYNNLRKDWLTGSKSLITETDSATIDFDLDSSNLQEVVLGGNRTLTVTNSNVGQVFVVRIKQDATGSRTVTWFSTINWTNGVVPILTTTATKTDVFGFICTATNTFDGFVIGQNI